MIKRLTAMMLVMILVLSCAAAGEAASRAVGETCMTAGDTAAAIPEVFRKELNPSQEGENEDVH